MCRLLHWLLWLVRPFGMMSCTLVIIRGLFGGRLATLASAINRRRIVGPTSLVVVTPMASSSFPSTQTHKRGTFKTA